MDQKTVIDAAALGDDPDVADYENYLDDLGGDDSSRVEVIEDDSTTNPEPDKQDSDEDSDQESDEDSDEDSDEQESDEDPNEGLSKKQKERINQRFAEITSKQKAAEEELAREKDHNRLLEERLNLMEAGKSRMNLSEAAKALQMHPLFLENDPKTIDERLDQIHQFEMWAAENDEDEVQVDGNVYLQKDIRRRLAEIRHERDAILPKVRETIRQRSAMDQIAKEQYPKLFERYSEDYQVYQKVLAELPQLRQFPQLSLMIGDMIQGARHRMQQNQSEKDSKKPAQVNSTRRKPAPKLRTPKPHPTPVRESKNKSKVNERRLIDSNYDPDVVAEMLD